jgi:hypothetical protein
MVLALLFPVSIRNVIDLERADTRRRWRGECFTPRLFPLVALYSLCRAAIRAACAAMKPLPPVLEIEVVERRTFFLEDGHSGVSLTVWRSMKS